MSLTIMRRIKFCAGHRLHKHGGKCEHFHGHNYMADFYVTGDQVDAVGRVIDFAELKKLFKGWLDENWDHGFVLNKDDENGLAAVKIVDAMPVLCAAVQPDVGEYGDVSISRSLPEAAGGEGRHGDKGRHLGERRVVCGGVARKPEHLIQYVRSGRRKRRMEPIAHMIKSSFAGWQM